MALREDVAKLDRYIEQMDFLYQHKIEDKQSLQEKTDNLQAELKALYIKRKQLYSAKKYAVRHHDAPKIEQTKSEIRDNADAMTAKPEIEPVNTSKMTTNQQILHDRFGKSVR